MYFANVYNYDENKIYYIGDVVLHNGEEYICSSVNENDNMCVTGSWNETYWSKYDTIVFQSIAKDKLNKPLKYFKPYQYNHESRYKKTRRIQDEETNVLYHESVPRYYIALSDNDKHITIKKDGIMLDSIAYTEYGTPIFWWVIALANNIMDATNGIKYGTTLRIPSILDLYSQGSIFS